MHGHGSATDKRTLQFQEGCNTSVASTAAATSAVALKHFCSRLPEGGWRAAFIQPASPERTCRQAGPELECCRDAHGRAGYKVLRDADGHTIARGHTGGDRAWYRGGGRGYTRGPQGVRGRQRAWVGMAQQRVAAWARARRAGLHVKNGFGAKNRGSHWAEGWVGGRVRPPAGPNKMWGVQGMQGRSPEEGADRERTQASIGSACARSFGGLGFGETCKVIRGGWRRRCCMR